MSSEAAIDGRQVMMLKWSHVIFTLVVWLLTVGILYGTMRAQMDEVQRRESILEERKVDQKQFDELRDDIIRRLDRIEAKVDRERSLRELH